MITFILQAIEKLETNLDFFHQILDQLKKEDPSFSIVYEDKPPISRPWEGREINIDFPLRYARIDVDNDQFVIYDFEGYSSRFYDPSMSMQIKAYCQFFIDEDQKNLVFAEESDDPTDETPLSDPATMAKWVWKCIDDYITRSYDEGKLDIRIKNPDSGEWQ